MIRKIILILILFNSLISFSQNEIDINCPNNSSSSNKNLWKGNNELLRNFIKNYPQLDSGHIYYNVPITFHIFLNTRENIELLNSDLKKVVKNLNKIYSENKTGIQFYLSDLFYYREIKHLKAGYLLESFLFGHKNFNKNSINVYFVNVLELNLLFTKIHYRGMYNSLNNTIIIIRHSTQTTLAHEIGHYLGLYHPHRNWEKGKNKQEAVSRTLKKGDKLNCECNGDYLSDTPAEPDLRFYTDKDCDYTGLLKDDWGDFYQPNTNNIMSYPSNSQCRSNFTTLQKAVMLFTIHNLNISNKWKICDENNLFSPDIFEPDDSKSMATELVFCKSQYHTLNWILDYKNKMVLNNTDWFYFNLSNPQKINLILKSRFYSFPPMDLYILDSNFKCLYTFELKKFQNIELNLVEGKYFIKIQSPNIEKEEAYDYNISLE